MSRILFAAARGARIQYRSPVEHKWKANFFLPNCLNDSLYRIHPKDEHLQYGPISTELRDGDGEFQRFYIIDSEHMPNFVIRCAIFAKYANNMMHEWQQNKDRLTRSLFLLFLAEALADEGM